jgi:ATP-dependent exoDNAse (exonuclease V) beta subunit
MQISTDKPLKILNASAGSGKTFNLVKEYLLLLLCDDQSTHKFAHIIAMTFTNKAALEMKVRIIQALDELSFPKRYGKKSEHYAELIGGELEIPIHEVHTRARRVLQNILHRYEDFHVMTIDKFNLKLIRSFSRDLDLPNDFEIILNESEIRERVVDTMLMQLGQDELKELTRLVFAYAEHNIEEGEKWNFRKNLIDFAEVLEKEKYFEQIALLMKSDFSAERLKILKFEKQRLNDHFCAEAQEVYKVYTQESLTQDELPGKSGTEKILQKLKLFSAFPDGLFTPTVLKYCEEDPTTKGKRFPASIREAMINLQVYWEKNIEEFATLNIYIKNYYNMALLQFMANALEFVKKDEQLIRISEFNKLISSLVKNEDAPFIYERLGIRFQHFLLDEFQDTSHLQWLNMVPLIHESISQENRNLIVGDPKQSIYRFKNGVAEQFVALPAIYNPDNDPAISNRSTYFKAMGTMSPLADNWRSSPVVVDFNNAFFEELREELSPEFKSFYHSVSQIPQSSKKGYVEIRSKKLETGEQGHEIERIFEWIKQCELDGYHRGDICILGNKNKECNAWAVALSAANYQVVSADSLLVNSSPQIKLSIAYLHRRLNPVSENEKRRFAELFFRMKPEMAYTAYKKYLVSHTSKTGRSYTLFNDDQFLVDHFGSSARFFEKYETLYDLIQLFYGLMNYDELKNPYLHHLADLAHDFDLMKGPDLQAFLNEYASKGHKSAVQLPESENAIRIMSIHKSKGLEFPVVILPKMDYDLSIRNNSKFLIPSGDKLLYTNVSGKSHVKPIQEFHEAETAQILTDNINKCYVAMTRPIERLYINNEFSKTNFGAIFHKTLTCLPIEKIEIDKEIKLKLGDSFKKTYAESTTENTFFTPLNLEERLWFPDIALHDKKELMDQESLSDAQRYGNQFHNLLSEIKNPQEIDLLIQDHIKSGWVEQEFMERLSLDIHALFDMKEYRELFEDALEVLSEQSILVDEKTVKRPDKIILKKNETIVIDYKTGMPENKHIKQLSEYSHVLNEIGYPHIRPFIFYTATKELVGIAL